jgi:predicted Rossmann fold flavoprotein
MTLAAGDHFDLIVIGAGAAGLAAAIFCARAAPGLRIACLDGAKTIGAKILVSGGSRCNVTNRRVTEHDFWGGSRRVVRHVLRAFPAARAAAFFEELGVPLHEEEDGKLFPDSNRSRSVLDALLREAERLRVSIRSAHRVRDVQRDGDRFAVDAATGMRVTAARIVLATGGRSLPKTGSDGFGYELAARLGHGHVATTPALAPLLVQGEKTLTGVAHPAAMALRIDGRAFIRLEGPLLWTHFGVSGPLALNLSRHWHRARLDGHTPGVVVNLLPGETFESLEAWWLEQERARPRAQLGTVLSTRLPAAVADAWIAAAGVPADVTLAHVTRERRRRLVHSLLETPLAVTDSRGYSYAEVTAGGVPLDEIDPATMQSRVCEGLYLVGEILDVDGRLGGFNFHPGGRMEPARWLVDHADLLPEHGDALDVAGGRGRNAVWLAQRGLTTLALDRDEAAVQFVRDEADRRGLPLRASTVDLEQRGFALEPQSHDVIVVVHYLHRPLFPTLRDALRPGGVLVYETFTREQAQRGRPTNPAFLLEPGELRELVQPLDVVVEREGDFEGKMLASVIARRP